MSEPNPANASRSEDEALSFVERETRRRKRLLRFYLAMLAVPILLAAAVLLFGRSDRQMVTEEIKTQAPAVVRQAAGDQFAPAIQTEVQNQITPTLGQINELKTRQDSIAEEVKTLSASNAKLTPEEVETIRQSGQRLSRQDTAIAELQNATRQSGERLANQDAAIRELQTQTASISGQLKNLSEIQGRLGRLEAQIKILSGKLDGRIRGGINQGTKVDGKP
jgi:DNA repair exonuclease SbcCD ATPase subunit